MAAAAHKLDNFTVIMDVNRIQNDDHVENVLPMGPIAPKWEAFGWHVTEIDGHDMAQVVAALEASREVKGRPAMIVAQIAIAFPLVVSLTAAGVQQLDPGLAIQLRSLGASPARLLWLLLKEARLSVLAAVMAGFGGAISEVGAVMMVGGNVHGQTRVLTTAIVEHTRMGQFRTAVVLGLVLLAMAFAVNLYFTHLQQRVGRR